MAASTEIPLVGPADQQGLPGGPFTDAVLAAACRSIRNTAGWHIAPVITETVTIDAVGGQAVILPTLQLRSVIEVRWITFDSDGAATSTVLKGWSSAATQRFVAGVLHRPSGWPFGVLEIDIEHGHNSCPPDLFPTIGYRARQARSQMTGGSVRLGSLSITPPSGSTSTPDDAVDAYRLPKRP